MSDRTPHENCTDCGAVPTEGCRECELIAKIEQLQADVDCDTHLLEIMQKHAVELEIKYDGDQEYLVAVKVQIKQLRARVKDLEMLVTKFMAEADWYYGTTIDELIQRAKNE